MFCCCRGGGYYGCIHLNSTSFLFFALRLSLRNDGNIDNYDTPTQVSDVLSKAEDQFLQAYRAHMQGVHKEKMELEAKLQESENEQANDKQIQSLEKDRDWYKEQRNQLEGYVAAMQKVRFVSQWRKERCRAVSEAPLLPFRNHMNLAPIFACLCFVSFLFFSFPIVSLSLSLSLTLLLHFTHARARRTLYIWRRSTSCYRRTVSS